MRRAASRAAARDVTAMPLSHSASIRFGVTTAARGSSRACRRRMPSSSSRRLPLVDTSTGSTTGRRASASSAAQTASTTAPLASIPVLAPDTGNAAATASICAATTAGGITCVSAIPFGLWAVTAVTALRPWRPNAAKVRRSACRPAPPPESLPAMDSAARIGIEGGVRPLSAGADYRPAGARASSGTKTSRY